MENILNASMIKMSHDRYLKLIIIIAPLLNFLSGISFDLHAPSLPAISIYFSSSASAAKNTITISLLGFSIGCIVFGALLDMLGRRSVMLVALTAYTIASFMALNCESIAELLVVRFIQGFAVSCVSIGCRTIIIDCFKGHEFKVAMLYSSLAFGLGLIVAPFMGGFIQDHFGWKANFVTYGAVSFCLLVIFALYVAESKPSFEKFYLKTCLLNYVTTLRIKSFIPGIIIGGLSQLHMLIYTVTGSFLIISVLHGTATSYGNSALIISSGYLIGTLINRFFIKKYSVCTLINVGFGILFFALLLQLVFSLFFSLSMFTIVCPITLIVFSQGFIFINVLTSCLKLSTTAGAATALFTCAVMLIGTLGTNIVSHINVTNLACFSSLFGIPALIQLLIYYSYYKEKVKND